MSNMNKTGVTARITPISDRIEVSGNTRWMSTYGTPGIMPDGTLSDMNSGMGYLVLTAPLAESVLATDQLTDTL
ncbi:hypothetical protein KSC_107160 [Ktedonobacter sp. SOSP1-52]|nr:hypothetical protein KSC_107160 [Ktedonobacter sp. SOSP1-52]